jgi:hypothetical protein
MPLSDAEIKTVERELSGNHIMQGSRSASSGEIQKENTVPLERLFPTDWRAQAAKLTLTDEESRSVDGIVTALRAYRQTENDFTPQKLFECWSSLVADNEDALRLYVFVPLIQLIKLERDIDNRLKGAVLDDSVKTDAYLLPNDVEALVRADTTRISRRNEYLASKSIKDLKEKSYPAIDAAKKLLATLDEILPSKETKMHYKPDIDENGGLVMSVCSHVRRRRNGVYVEVDEDDDDDESDDDDDNAADEQQQRASLDTVLFNILWQGFKFIAMWSVDEALPLLVEAVLLFYQSGTNSAMLAGMYKNINFEGYESFVDVPLQSFLVGDYGTGLYGVRNPQAVGGVTQVPSVSLNMYNELANVMQNFLLEATIVVFGRDRSYLSVFLTAAVVRTIVIKMLRLGMRGGGYAYQRMITRVRSHGNPKN